MRLDEAVSGKTEGHFELPKVSVALIVTPAVVR